MTDGISIAVRPVDNRRERELFIKLPFALYEGDPNWVPPLILAERDRLNPRKNPFFEHADAELLLAWRGNRVVGRIAAIDDRLHNETWGDNLAFFGFLEAETSEVAAALLDAAEQWARDRGRDALRGPASPSLNDMAGLLVDGFDSPPLLMMPYNPPTYPEWVAAAGYAKIKDLWAWWWPIAASVNPRTVRILKRIERSLVPAPVIRHMGQSDFAADVETVRQIFSKAWRENWGFVAPTPEEFRHAAKDMKQIMDPKLATIMEIDGRPVAFSLTLPDLNQVFQNMNGRLLPFGIFKLLRKRRYVNQCRLLLLGVIPEYRQKGLELLLIAHSIRIVEGYGWTGGECSWTLEDNDGINKAIAAVGAERSKTYRMYEKPLT